MPGKRDLDPEVSPPHFFGAEVRRAREAAAMTLADLGVRVPCDASTVSRIESGQLSPAERFARACDEAFPQMGGWFGRFYRASLKWDAPYPRWFEDWVDAEGRAAVIRWWEPLLVPGLLQTPEYARALFRAWRTDDDQDKVELNSSSPRGWTGSASSTVPSRRHCGRYWMRACCAAASAARR